LNNFVTNFLNELRKASSKGKLYVFIICIFLSSFLWLLNALGNYYLSDINYDVTYYNLPKDKVIINDLPSQLKIKIKGLGFDILSYKLKLTVPKIKIDLSDESSFQKNENNLLEKSIPTDKFKNGIQAQVNSKVEIKNIYPQAINLIVDEKVVKTLKVKADTKISCKKQFNIFGKINIKPSVNYFRYDANDYY